MSPEPIVEPVAGNPIKVSISLKHENQVINKSSSVTQDDLYAISIYSATNGGNDTYSRYAYGMFGVNELPQIELLDNQKYRIEYTVVKNGASIIGKDAKGRYYDPFITSSVPCGITSDFILSSTIGFTGLYKGLAAIADGSYIGHKKYARPMIDRYCGVIVDYSPSKSSTLELFAKRTVFGLTPSAEGFTEGSIEVEVEGAPVINIDPSTAVTEHIISLGGDLSNIYSITDDSYVEQVTLMARWLRDDGSVVNITPVDGQLIDVQRKYSYPIVVRFKQEGQSSSIIFESPTLNIADSIVIAI